jgi:hypothetical protein
VQPKSTPTKEKDDYNAEKEHRKNHRSLENLKIQAT